MPQDEIDINKALSTRAKISLDPEETVTEHTARIKREADEARFELVKGYVSFFTILMVIIALGTICLYEAVWDAAASPETKRWAATLVTSLFAGSVSFVLGQKTAKSK